MSAAAQHHGLGVVYCNLVGGNDSLVFDGNSMVVGPDGTLYPLFSDQAWVDGTNTARCRVTPDDPDHGAFPSRPGREGPDQDVAVREGE